MASVDNRKGKTLVKLSRRGNDPTPGDRESRRDHGKQRLDKTKEEVMEDPEGDQDHGMEQGGEESNSESDQGMVIANENDYEIIKEGIAAVEKEEKAIKVEEQWKRMERIRELTRVYAQSQHRRLAERRRMTRWIIGETSRSGRRGRARRRTCSGANGMISRHCGTVGCKGGVPFVGKHTQHRVQNR